MSTQMLELVRPRASDRPSSSRSSSQGPAAILDSLSRTPCLIFRDRSNRANSARVGISTLDRFRRPLNERVVGFHQVPPLDAPDRRVRFRASVASTHIRLPPKQTRRRQPLQNPRERRRVGLHIDPPAACATASSDPAPPRSTPGPGTTAASVNRPPALQSPAPRTRCPRNIRWTASRKSSHPFADSGGDSRSVRKRLRTAGRRTHRSRNPPGPLVQTLEEGMSVARRQVRRVHPHRRRLARRRSLPHCHGCSVYGCPSTPGPGRIRDFRHRLLWVSD